MAAFGYEFGEISGAFGWNPCTPLRGRALHERCLNSFFIESVLSSARTEWSNERMKLPDLFSVVLAMVGLASTSLAADYSDWVAKGYRWSVVNGLYAYKTKEDAKNEGSRFAGMSLSEMIDHAYFLRPGKLVLLVETDAAYGLSKIRMGGVTSDLWTPTKNLSTRPVIDTLGIIETPDMAGVLTNSSASPSPESGASVSPSPTATP
jgi:hypothetical protein